MAYLHKLPLEPTAPQHLGRMHRMRPMRQLCPVICALCTQQLCPVCAMCSYSLALARAGAVSVPLSPHGARVTNSSAAVGWMATVRSKSAFVAPIFTATAKPWGTKEEKEEGQNQARGLPGRQAVGGRRCDQVGCHQAREPAASIMSPPHGCASVFLVPAASRLRPVR